MAQKITPNLWFDGNAKEAVEYYVSVFPDSQIIHTAYYPKSSEEGLADFQKPLAGKALAIEFELTGQRFMAIN
ncbi:MAG: VOC family protein, partial [Candidatus Saccharimonadales bacterium]